MAFAEQKVAFYALKSLLFNTRQRPLRFQKTVFYNRKSRFYLCFMLLLLHKTAMYRRKQHNVNALRLHAFPHVFPITHFQKQNNATVERQRKSICKQNIDFYFTVLLFILSKRNRIRLRYSELCIYLFSAYSQPLLGYLKYLDNVMIIKEKLTL